MIDLVNYLNIKKQLHGTELIVVTKKQSLEDMQRYYNLGVRDFGENHVQELLTKVKAFADVRWHFIGHLQTNKVRALLPYVELIHSIDSLKLLACVNSEAERLNKIQAVLLEFNLAKDGKKGGFEVEEAEEIFAALKNYPHVKVEGLMIMGPKSDEAAVVDKCFKEAHRLFCNYQTAYDLHILSMGMSNDYPLAINNGATMVRIGSALFM